MQHYENWKDCTRCGLCKGRNNIVFGKGTFQARVMLIGEAPGEKEDLEGYPFVGPSGRLLDRMISHAGLSKEDIFITNTVKCRPPGNRDPLPQELEACYELLRLQIEEIQPQLLIGVGKFAGNWLMGTTNLPMSSLFFGGQYYNDEIPFEVIYHPSYILRLLRTNREHGRETYKKMCLRLRKALEDYDILE